MQAPKSRKERFYLPVSHSLDNNLNFDNMEQDDKLNQQKIPTFEILFKNKKCGTPKRQAEAWRAKEESKWRNGLETP
jgi:hypothetical protein